jgi:hypothetical protein
MFTPRKPARLIALVAILLAPSMLVLSAQIPGLNVNVVSIDPFLQKNNEPSLAVGTANPCRLLMGGNDYRTVDLPGLPADLEIGDAWPGVYQSTDCGFSWLAGLMPGFPQDQSPEGLVSPAKGFTTGADPGVRAGLGGVYFYSFIVFNRGTNLGKFLLARFLDPNNTQVTASTVPNTDPLLVPHSQWPIQYISPTLTVDGGTAQFLDRPGITTSKGAGTCNLNGRIVPATVVHIVWTVFLNNAPEGKGGNNVVNRINYNRSSDCGGTLDLPTTKLSESIKRSQGAMTAVHPLTNEVFVVWRVIDPDNPTENKIMFVKSSGGGKQFTSPDPIPTLNGLSFFDQATTQTTFRTIAFPTAVFDHAGRLHVLASVRSNNPDKSARIVETTTLDGVTWTPLTHISPSQTDEHQIMPAIDYSSGRLRAAWYDFIDDASGIFEQFVDDIHVLSTTGPRVRHTVDVRGAEGVFDTNGNVTWNTFGVIQMPGLSPKISQYLTGQEQGSPPQLLQFNRSNLGLYCGGLCAFIGDYMDVGGLGFVPVPTPQSEAGTGPPNWVVNGPATAGNYSQDFHAAWTDNRDAIVDSVIGDPSGTVLYSAPIPGCDPALTKTRNANIYTSRITPGLSLLLPVNTEPSNLIQRTFPFMIINGTTVQRTVNITIQNQPPGGGTASFMQVGMLTNIQVILPPKSSAARTVFVSSTTKYPPIRIFAAENVSNPTLTASAFINPDPTNLDLQGPSAQTETHDVAIGNPDMHTPDLENPDLENPDLENPDLENPDLENPDLENPDLENPDLENPDLENPDMENPSIVDGVVTDTSYTLTNVGVDLSAYQVDVDLDGKNVNDYFYQLIARRVIKKPTAKGCQQAYTWQNQVLFNITTPDVSFASFTASNDPAAKNATFMLFPGESIRLTLRAWDKDAKNNGISSVKDPKLDRFCAFTDADAGCSEKHKKHTVTVKIRPQAANTGAQAPTVVTFVQQ